MVVQEREVRRLGGGNGPSMSVVELHKAAKRGDVAEMRRLVAAGVDVDVVSMGSRRCTRRH